MPCLIEAFEHMRRRGLIAERECYCEHGGQDVVRQAAQRCREKQKDARGFVHLGEWDAPAALEVLRVPLVFGSVTGGKVAYRDPGCLAVGEVVAECLNEQGIRYEWDRVPGNPILVLADDSLTGIPTEDGHPATDLSEDHRVFRNPMFPERVFDKLPGNPVRLLNVAKVRRLNVAAPHLRGTQGRPRVGDQVKLSFLVWDAVAPAARQEFGEKVRQVQLESMWVEVTSVLGRHPQCVYRGELVNVPVFIDPAKLRIGSPVNFTPDQVYAIERRSRTRAGR